MILIDCVYINNGGGLVLLKYLVDQIEKTGKEVFYLFDCRVERIFHYIPCHKKKCIPNSIIARWMFYIQYKNNFSSILCFGNIPPLIKLECNVYTYFHQPLFLDIPSSFSVKSKIIYTVKQMVLKNYLKNSNYWIVQTNLIANKFAHKYLSDDLSKVIILPFYPPLDFGEYEDIVREENKFLYVSNSSPHKNHYLLIEAFCEAFDEIKLGKLTLTIPSSDTYLCELITSKNELGYPIENVGFVDRKELVKQYLRHEYLIFPSLAESFGLGLAEAIDGRCKIIAADLPYTYEVCKPSLSFDPTLKESIKDAIIRACCTKLSPSIKLISNDVGQLIRLLS